jgi:hypothetical protein
VKVQKTLITIETHRTVVVRRRRVTRCWCEKCGDEGEFIPVEAVNRLLEGASGQGTPLPPGEGFHFNRSQNGAVLVCIRSLSSRLTVDHGFNNAAKKLI